MIPLTGGILGAAAVVAAPALWGGVEGTIEIDEALTRYLVAVAVCWLVLAIVIDLTFPAPGRVRAEEQPVEHDDEPA